MASAATNLLEAELVIDLSVGMGTDTTRLIDGKSFGGGECLGSKYSLMSHDHQTRKAI